MHNPSPMGGGCTRNGRRVGWKQEGRRGVGISLFSYVGLCYVQQQLLQLLVRHDVACGGLPAK